VVTKATRSMMLVAVLAFAAPAASFADNSHKHDLYGHATAPDDGKSFWQRLVPSFSTDGRAKVTGDLTPETNWKNSSEQKKAGKSRKAATRTVARPAKKTHTRTSRPRVIAKVSPKASPKAPPKDTEAWWWQNVGNPPVDTLSDCLDAYAAKAVRLNANVQAADVVKQAIASDCRPKYDEVLKVLSGGLTKARYDQAMAELQQFTFLPTVNSVLNQARLASSPQPRVEPASITATLAPGDRNEPADVTARKQAMFDCFNREADALALQNPAAPPVLAREVVARCDEATRGFFAALFKVYPVDKKAHNASVAIAVQQNYMPAIARRIAIVRQGQPTISGSNTSGSADDTRARTTVVTEQ